MLILCELIVCSTKGLACILAKWFRPTETSLSLTYGIPEASYNKHVETYFGRQRASLIKEFWTLFILSMIVSETVIVEKQSHTRTLISHIVCKSLKWLRDLDPIFHLPIFLSDEIVNAAL